MRDAVASAALLSVAFASSGQGAPAFLTPLSPASSSPSSSSIAAATSPASAASAARSSLGSATTVPPPPFQWLVDGRLTATNNSALVESQFARSDVVADLKTDLLLNLHGARLDLSGAAGIDLIGYADHTQTDRALPRGHVDLNATLIDHNLFFDGGVDAERTRADAFAAQGEGSSTANTLSTITYRASPYFEHAFSPELSVLARSDTIVTHSFGSTVTNADTDVAGSSTVQRETLRIERRPTPIGVSAEVSREDTAYSDAGGTALRIDSAKVTGSAALDADWLAGLIAGYDRADYSLGDESHALYGLMARWRPDGRTLLDAEVERRFFGTGWRLEFRHRWPLTIVDATFERSPSATPASNTADSAADAAKLFGPTLTAGLPVGTDPASAARALLASHGLPTDFSRPLLIFSDSAQVFQRANVSVETTGVRTSLGASAFYVKATTLNNDGSSPTALAVQPFDSVQKGGTLALNRRLASDTTGTAQLTWSDLQGLGTHAGESARQTSGALSLTRALSPLSSLTAGVQRLLSKVVADAGAAATPTHVNETQAYIGLRMRY